MKIVYFVYREDNTMVFDSQVLEYLQLMKEQSDIDSVDLILFRNNDSTMSIESLDSKVKKYVDSFESFYSLPVLTHIQLYINSLRAKKMIKKKYKTDEKLGIICRGELASYIAIKSFKDYPNARVLFDNRGLPYEESFMRYKFNIIHMINRSIKKDTLVKVKSKCDMYNFVTSVMRDYLIQEYQYETQVPYTVIPTLYKRDMLDKEELDSMMNLESITNKDLIINYTGSTEMWQSTEKLVDIIKMILSKYDKAKCFILTNGKIPQIELLEESIRKRITVKAVPHKLVKYYLYVSDIGIVIRDDNIINRVAAPTKIAEYLMNGVCILCSGRIGVLDDISKRIKERVYVNIDEENDWIDKIGDGVKLSNVEDIIDYFDMNKRMQETLSMIKLSFENAKKSI